MTSGPSAKDVAVWMLEELRREEMLDQEMAAYEIVDRFGERFTYYNDYGNLAISKAVLDAFRKLTGDDIVWCRSDRCWRQREEWDLPGRMQP